MQSRVTASALLNGRVASFPETMGLSQPSLADLQLCIARTDKTDNTYTVGNDEFLRATFGDKLMDVRPVVVSFTGNPASAPAKAWFGTPWPSDRALSADLPADANNYFSLAAFRPDDTESFRRLKNHFHTLHAIMLDDVGSKVGLERLTLPPSWLLETSPGNHQAGYLLSEPLTDGLSADRLMNAVIAARLCDPGAGGPRTRLARLPVAVNGKHTPPFVCRLTEWSPALRYSVHELVDGLQLDLAQVARPKRLEKHSKAERPSDDDSVWIPRPEENAVLVTVRGRGLYKTPLGDGRHDITCPWVKQHTGEIDGGTAYFEPDDNWPIGGFRCLHGHCARRHIRDLLGFLDVDANAARMKPTIRVIGGQVHRVVDAAERELASTFRYYQMGGLIVTVATDPGSHETQVRPITQPALVGALAGAATWERFDARTKDWARVDPPARHVSGLCEATSYLHLQVLRGIARQPYLRPDGSLMTEAGYDAATGLFGVFDAGGFSVPERPTRAQAKAALELLRDLLAEFSFASQADFAAALVALLTAAIRPSLTHAPMFHVRAHMVGSGKSYLCELISALATPQRGTPSAFPAKDEECSKMLLAELLRGPAVIVFDNLTGDLVPHKSLCTALTSEHLSGRILGISKMATVGTRALFLSSGNNVGPVRDMTRRCITIHLSPEYELPAARSFTRPNLVRDVRRERGKYVSAALTIVRARIAAGSPKIDCKPLAGFDSWSDWCRQSLLELGLVDPVESVFQAMTEDPDREALALLLTTWQAAFGQTPAMVRDFVKLVMSSSEENAPLRDVLLDIAGEGSEINRNKLGWWLKRNEGRLVGGKRFVRASGSRSAAAWKVASVSPVASVFNVLSAECVTGTVNGREAYVRASRGE